MRCPCWVHLKLCSCNYWSNNIESFPTLAISKRCECLAYFFNQRWLAIWIYLATMGKKATLIDPYSPELCSLTPSLNAIHLHRYICTWRPWCSGHFASLLIAWLSLASHSSKHCETFRQSLVIQGLLALHQLILLHLINYLSLQIVQCL